MLCAMISKANLGAAAPPPGEGHPLDGHPLQIVIGSVGKGQVFTESLELRGIALLLGCVASVLGAKGAVLLASTQ